MTSEYLRSLEPARRNAVSELTDVIRQRFPSSTFVVEPGTDDSEATYLTASVDLDDPDEVMDLIIDRLVELQVEGGIPLSVIPIRTPARVARLAQQQRRHDYSRALLPSNRP